MMGPEVTGVGTGVSIRIGLYSRITTLPLTMCMQSRPKQTSSTVFHSPLGFSLSGCLMHRPDCPGIWEN
jgi:hypothetical protein